MPLQLPPPPNFTVNTPQMPDPLQKMGQLYSLKNMQSEQALRAQLAPLQVQEQQQKAQQAGIQTQMQQQELDSRTAMMKMIASGELNKYAGVETSDGSGFDAAGAYQHLISNGVLPAHAGEYANSWLTIGKNQAEISKNLGEAGKAQQEIREKTLKQVANKLGDIGDMTLNKATNALDAFRQDLVKNPNAYTGLTKQEMAELYSADLTHLDALEGHLGIAAQVADFHKSKAEAAAVEGKTDPNSPFYDPSASYLAKRAAAGDPDAKAILAQQAKQAGAKAGAEQTAKSAAEFPYQQKLEQLRQGGTPVYAYDPKQNATVLTTKEEAQQNGLQAIRKVGENDIAKDTQTARQLGDAQLNVSAYRMASQKMDELSGTDIRNVARLTGSQEFKAQFLGAEMPMDWANQLAKNNSWQSLPQDAKEAVASYIGARGAIIAYAKAISGTGRLTESQLKTETANLPDPTTPSDVREMQFTRFQRNIDQVASGLPKLPGVDSPAAIRARVEGQAGAEATTRANIAAREAAKSGQYTNAKGYKMTVGQDAYDSATKRYVGTVSKVYRDGSYDVKPD
jgi:hypothetical protein